MKKTKFDISVENFDFYFAKQAKESSPEERARLPQDVVFNLFKQGGGFKKNAMQKLGFLGMVYTLWKLAKKRFFIVIEDENNGLTEGQFLEVHKAIKNKDYSSASATAMLPTGMFVLGGTELTNTFSYLNRCSISPAFNYLHKVKNLSPNISGQYADHMAYVLKFVANYESNKRKMILGTGLEVPEWLVLIYLYNGNMVPSSPIHSRVYKNSYHSSKTRLKVAFGTLQRKGYIEKIGASKGTNIRITSLGKEAVNDIMDKYFINI